MTRAWVGHLVRRWALLAGLLGVWQGAAMLGLVDPWLLPAPAAVLARGAALLTSGRLLGDLAASAWRVALGFGLAALLALPLGIVLGLYPRVEEVSAPLLSLLRPLSPPAWIPLAILWFGIGDAPAVFVIFLGTFFGLLPGALAAARAVDPQTLLAALTLGAGRWQSLRHVVLPSLAPALLAQVRLGFGLAWMCVIAAEMVAVRRGLGFMMLEARNLFRTEDVLVGMLVIGLVGLAMDRVLWRLEKALCPWRVGLEAARAYARPGADA
ncbi:MAG: ABC transporter permease [Anaerolineae bacterium]